MTGSAFSLREKMAPPACHSEFAEESLSLPAARRRLTGSARIPACRTSGNRRTYRHRVHPPLAIARS
jgi:hypothetical protein